MVNNQFKTLYEQVFYQIKDQIKGQNGVLRTVIFILLDQDIKQAEELCNYFQISRKSLLDDDLSISSDIIGLFISTPNDQLQGFKDGWTQATQNFRKSFSKLEPHDMKLFQVVVIGCLIVGGFACIKYLDNSRKKNQLSQNIKTQEPPNPPPKPKTPQPVALCLIVPASAIGNLTKNSPIHITEIEQLIDKSLYFLCTSVADANIIWDVLERTEEDIKTLSEEREVYIRINIPDGEEMMGKKVPYILKRNLPSQGECMIKQLASLKYLSVSGLEKFNRV